MKFRKIGERPISKISYDVEDEKYYADLYAKIIPRQNGTQSGIEALKKSLERSKK